MEVTLVVITLLSLTAAAGMAIVTWRVLQDARQRADARVAVLEEGLAASLDLDLNDSAVTPDPELRAGRGVMTFAIGSVSVLLLIFAMWAVIRLTAPGIGASADLRGAGARSTTAAAAAAPLELVALEQTRAGAALTVNGVVRNPLSGAMIDRLSVTVAFFDANGQQLASVRAPLDYRTLAPGDESPFQVTTSVPTGVTRYRVSFRRSTCGTMVPSSRRKLTRYRVTPVGTDVVT
jgi:hypothetical protein